MIGVMWHHWAPKAWRGPFPFEIGLFFFLTLTGFLITRILLRERMLGDSTSLPWRTKTYIHFLKRRMVRILTPCYVAMIFAIVVGAPDIQHYSWLYFAHLSNFHMAYLDAWPSGTAHYWTLAIQMQFYLIWPLVVFFTPKKAMLSVFLIFTAIAPISRMVLARHFPEIHHSEAISTSSLDYFAIGSLLALAIERGMTVGDTRMKWGGLIALGGYLILYISSEAGRPIAGFCLIQQTLLSIAFVGLISSTLSGLKGLLGRILENPFIQHTGRLSYGLYLFHTPVPLFLGWVLPWLWHPFFNGPWLVVRLLVFALTSWGLACLCWKYLERSNAPARQGPSILSLPDS